MEQKSQKKLFVFKIIAFAICIGKGKFSQSGSGYLASTVNVLTNTLIISNLKKADFLQIILPSEWRKNMIKVLSRRLHNCLGSFSMLTVLECSETVLFKEWSHQVFDSLYFRKYISYEDFIFFENVWNLM